MVRHACWGGFKARRRLRYRKSGIFTAELIMTMPVFMIFLLATFQFGIFFANLHIVSLASRVGAEAASENDLNAPGVPSSVVNAVEQHLFSSGIDYCRIRLEHNHGGQQAYVYPTSGACACEPNTDLVAPPPETYVRVTVCVQLSELMPNLLTVFGYDVSDPTKVVSRTTVMRNELYDAPGP